MAASRLVRVIRKSQGGCVSLPSCARHVRNKGAGPASPVAIKDGTTAICRRGPEPGGRATRRSGRALLEGRHRCRAWPGPSRGRSRRLRCDSIHRVREAAPGRRPAEAFWPGASVWRPGVRRDGSFSDSAACMDFDVRNHVCASRRSRLCDSAHARSCGAITEASYSPELSCRRRSRRRECRKIVLACQQ